VIEPKVDAVVIGAGAGGGIAAKELAQAGLKVVLFDKGRWYTAWDCRKDDLRNQRTTFLGNAFGPEPEDKNPRVFVDLENKEHVVAPSEGAYSNNASCVGGGTLSYGAMAWRYMPQDFRMRSTYGAPEGSTLEDWPLTYDELEPFYTKAEWEIGVSGDNSKNPFCGHQSKPLPKINQQLADQGFYKAFPPPGIEVVSWYVMMGVGQVVTLRVPADRLREVNRAIEETAWGGYRTEFYPTYDYKAIAEQARAKSSK